MGNDDSYYDGVDDECAADDDTADNDAGMTMMAMVVGILMSGLRLSTWCVLILVGMRTLTGMMMIDVSTVMMMMDMMMRMMKLSMIHMIRVMMMMEMVMMVMVITMMMSVMLVECAVYEYAYYVVW